MPLKKEQFLKQLGKQLTQLREEQGLSQSDLALKALKDRQNIHRLENGKINPGVYFLYELAVELEIDLADLFQFLKKPAKK